MSTDFPDRPNAEFSRMVLESVACDFASIESIIKYLDRRDACSPPGCEEGFVEAALFDLVSSGLIGAYLIHADPPYFTPVDPSPETVGRYWFIITDIGRKQLQPGQETPASVPSD